MDEKKRIKDLVGEDLTGYQIGQAHFINIKTALMAFYPAQYNDGSREMVVSLDLEVMQEVRKLLPSFDHEQYGEGNILCLAKPNDPEPHCFSLMAREPLEGVRMRLLTREGFDQLVKQHPEGKPFKWPPC